MNPGDDLAHLLQRVGASGRVGRYDFRIRNGAGAVLEALGGEFAELCVTWGLRFGNSVQQVCNSLFLARKLGIQNVVLPGLWWIKCGEFRLPDGTRIKNLKQTCPDVAGLTIRGDFYDLRPLLTVHSHPHAAWMALVELRPYLSVASNGPSLGERELVVHIRSGDIAAKDGAHPGYGQPPLAFYQKVIESSAWDAVHIVSENKLNPVCGMLESYCSKRGMPVSRICGELDEDLGFLLRAKSLVVGRGTFACAVAALSENLQTAHMFESWFCPWGNPRVTVCKWHDRGGDYRSEVLGGNWTNNERQRLLMLNYPVGAISEAPVSGPCGERWKCSSPRPFF